MLGASAERRRPSAIMSSVVLAWDSAETGSPSHISQILTMWPSKSASLPPVRA